jgi:hypothetical protein
LVGIFGIAFACLMPKECVMELADMSAEAREWLEKELAELYGRSPSRVAQKIEAKVNKVRRQLTQFPQACVRTRDPEIRYHSVASYILTLRCRGGVTEIAAIRHKKQADAYGPREVFGWPPGREM